MPELLALQEIAVSPIHAPIPESQAARLVELRLAYRLLGEVRITSQGRKRLNSAPR